jgi:hypothetical protein
MVTHFAYQRQWAAENIDLFGGLAVALGLLGIGGTLEPGVFSGSK